LAGVTLWTPRFKGSGRGLEGRDGGRKEEGKENRDRPPTIIGLKVALINILSQLSFAANVLLVVDM